MLHRRNLRYGRWRVGNRSYEARKRHENHGDCGSPWIAAFGRHARGEPSRSAFGFEPSEPWSTAQLNLSSGGRCTKKSAMGEGATEDGRAYDAKHVRTASRLISSDTTGNVMASGLRVLFGEFAKLIGNGSRRSQHDRSVSDCIPSETIADHVDSAVSRPARHPSLGARPAFFIFKPQRKFQLHLPVLLKMRHGDRQQRYGLLLRVIGERRTNELFGDFGKGSGR
jgi:hypothetical protein